MQIELQRAYADPTDNDGYRVLVDRLWPRGRKKEDLRLDAWLKDIAPSTELRKEFGHNPTRWEEFKQLYFEELDNCPEAIEELLARAAQGRLTLVFAAKDEQHNNAVALREYLQERMSG